MRKLNKQTFCEKPEVSDCQELTEDYFGCGITDIQKLVEEMHSASEIHEFTRKSFSGWTSLPLRSLGGMTGAKASSASGEHASADPEKFQDTIAMQPYIKSLVDTVAVKHGGLLKVRLMKMAAGSSIGEHRDKFCGDEDKIMRFHIPIQTNPKVQFSVSRVAYHLEAGKLYLMNVSKLHSVVNGGTEDRIHLVFDVRI